MPPPKAVTRTGNTVFATLLPEGQTGREERYSSTAKRKEEMSFGAAKCFQGEYPKKIQKSLGMERREFRVLTDKSLNSDWGV